MQQSICYFNQAIGLPNNQAAHRHLAIAALSSAALRNFLLFRTPMQAHPQHGPSDGHDHAHR